MLVTFGAYCVVRLLARQEAQKQFQDSGEVRQFPCEGFGGHGKIEGSLHEVVQSVDQSACVRAVRKKVQQFRGRVLKFNPGNKLNIRQIHSRYGLLETKVGHDNLKK